MRSLDRVGALFTKEFRHLLRDWRVLATVLALPVFQLVLFAYAISFDVHDVPTLIVDHDRTPASRAYVDAYTAGGFFAAQGAAADVAEAEDALRQGRAKVVLIVESGFGQALAEGRPGSVDVMVDGSEPNAARLGQAYSLALSQRYGRQLAVTWASQAGVDAVGGGLEPRVRTWYNPDRASSIFLIPGFVVVIIMIVCVQQTAVTIVRERDQHTAEQLLISPLRHVELMVGKLLPWTLLSFFDMAVVVALGMGLFGLPLRGSLAVLLVASLIFVFASLAIGLIVSIAAPSIESANVLALLVAFLPGLLLSGLAFPLESLPAPLQWLSCAFPARYMVDIARGVFLKGNGFAEVATNLAWLTGYTFLALILAVGGYARSVRR